MIMSRVYTNRICGINIENSIASKSKGLNATIGVFFDGTGNNLYNILHNQKTNNNKKGMYNPKTKKKEEGYDSYNADFTNVVHLWEMYDENDSFTSKIYIEGPGTAPPKKVQEKLVSSGDEDSTLFGSALGTGLWGVQYKLSRANDLILDELKAMMVKYSKTYVESVTFDVFGFSRGATAARYFVNYTLRDPYSYIYFRLQEFCKEKDISKKIHLRFIGLFDTVSSEGLNQIISDSSKHTHLTIPSNIGSVVHLVAANEYRRFFPLTTINSAMGLGENCIEYVLPGAHSDIGGGYTNPEIEFLYMGNGYPSEKLLKKGNHNRDFRGYLPLDILLEKKWISTGDYNDAILKFSERKYNDIDIKTKKRKGIPPYRPVYNYYARIPLHIMYQVATSKKIKLKNNQMSKRKWAIPEDFPELVRAADYLKREFFARKPFYRISLGKKDCMGKFIPKGIDFIRPIGEEADKLLKGIRRRFLHLSARDETGHGATSNLRRSIIEG